MSSIDTTTGEVADPLTDTEYDDLEKLETTISKGLDTFVEVGNALAEIRDRRLYRQYFPSFDAYCTEQWDIGKSRAYRLIAAAEVVAEMSPAGDTLLPKTERAARELKDVDPAKRADVMAKASEDSPATAPKIREAAAELDPLLAERQRQAEARAQARAEKEAREKAEKAEAEAVMSARVEHNREHDPEARRRHINTTVRGFLMDDARHLVDKFDPVEAAAALTAAETAVTLADAMSLRAWLDTYCQTIESPGATVTNLRGVQ